MSNKQQNILVTGGLGYIGSHTVVELLSSGYNVIVVDNLSNSKLEVINRIKTITGKDFVFYQLDVNNKSHLDKVFTQHDIKAVIHFAAYKAVGESVAKPLEYYGNNISSLVSVLSVMKKYDVNNIVFSSSATVYGDNDNSPLNESQPTNAATNPYGWTKLIGEQILHDTFKANDKLSVAILRYFNPVGAHLSGLIGEDPNGIPNNLMPYISQVAVGKREYLQVFGSDYPTHDGTGVRDYIHVVDLAIGHVRSVDYLLTKQHKLLTVNLGTGTGYSVLDVVDAFAKASDKIIEYKLVARRDGDVATCYADPSLALQELNWKCNYNIHDMCRDSWNWQKNNPNGYNADE